MALDLEEIKRLHDKAYDANQTTRERASDDLVFYWVTQWDEDMLEDSQLAYRGEFNILRKAGRQIMSDLDQNPVQVDFEPREETRKDSAELLDGVYRADDQENTSIEAYEVGKQEAVVCGVGAWLLYTAYESMRGADNKQVIKRKPIFEANNVVFWDPNAKSLDKSDARYVSILAQYSEDAYKELVNELTGEDIDTINPSNFNSPEQSNVFPWISDNGDSYYVAKFFYREKIKARRLILMDPLGQISEVWESEIKEVEDELLDTGHRIIDEKKVDKWQVTQYIVSGESILDESVVAGQFLPVIPIYGERAYVEGAEHYEGCTRLAKDPSRLRNFILSYVADIGSRSPREKPIFFPEQIQGFEDMYSEAGADNNYPYYLQNRVTADGETLPPGPVGNLPGPAIPSPIAALVELTKEAVEDVANPGLPQNIADPDVSGKAIMALQARLDRQSMVYQMHYKHSKRRDAEVYASMAREVYDVPRRVKMVLPDGSRKDGMVLEQVIDSQTGDIVTIHDLRNSEFDVYTKIGPDYTTQKQETVEKLTAMVAAQDPGDPVRKILQLKILQLMDGVDFDDVRDYVNKQLILMGIRKPETPEEKQFAQAMANQPQQPSADMVLALAEEHKAKAEQMDALVKSQKVQLDAQNEGMKRQVDHFKALTDRMEALIKAKTANASVNEVEAKTQGQQLQNAADRIRLHPSYIPVETMSDSNLYDAIVNG